MKRGKKSRNLKLIAMSTPKGYKVKGYTKENITLKGIKELSEFLEVNRNTASALKHSGKIPFTEFGRKIVFNSTEVLAALEFKAKN